MQITVTLQGNTLQTLPLNAGVLTIGRAPDNGLVLPHPLVSRRHAELRLTPEGVTLTDLESTSGTFIGGELLLANQPRLLADGTEVRIGPFALRYRAERQEPENQEPENQEPRTENQEPRTREPRTGEPRTENREPRTENREPENREPENREPRTENPEPENQLPITNYQLPITNYQLPAPIARHTARLANGTGSRYLRDLPVIFHEADFLGRYLQIFETIWEALEQREDYIQMYFDPRTAPEPMLPWLASWLEIALNQHWPEARRRALIREASDLYRWRGTRYGMTRMIEVCTGLTPEIDAAPAPNDPAQTQPYVFRVRVTIPPHSNINQTLIEELISTHKPAHAGYVLELLP